ncbi:MAG: ABC transporter permease [Pontiellaceae bacterium]|nr:ABC transporter permease [Pontiellaceae bacterium]MBN2785346.1 ABC transporter permease [Pontiellaceae bacterium]
MKRSRLPGLTVLILLVFFYLPIVILVINSFNLHKYGGEWSGFTLKWYVRLFQDDAVWHALRNSLIIAGVSTAASTVLGTLAAYALHRSNDRFQKIHHGLIYMPLVLPDILMGMSLLLFFVAVGFQLGLTSICIAHITFCISYVAMVVLARLQDFDFSMMEAAYDLGANSWTATTRVLLPALAPGITAGALLAFTLSIDDFVITFFVAGPGSSTLPVHIYSMMKHSRFMPVINALSTLLLLVTFVAVGSSQLINKQKGADLP